MPAQRTKELALKALDGMAEIVRNEMLTRGVYITPEKVDPERSGAVCQGHRACAIGSLWLGGGVKLIEDHFYDYEDGEDLTNYRLPGVSRYERGGFVKRRPHLRLALDALDRQAQVFAKRNGLMSLLEETEGQPFKEDGYYRDDAIEDLFEGHEGLQPRSMLRMIDAAKAEIQAAA